MQRLSSRLRTSRRVNNSLVSLEREREGERERERERERDPASDF
jgi:hypothetical protein